MPDDHHLLASYQRCVNNVQARWNDFLRARTNMLSPAQRFGRVAEKASENIVGTLLTTVLDWSDRDLNWQLDYADLVVTNNFFKHLVVETKRPGLLWSESERLRAIEQARGYALEQKINRLAITDGELLFATNVENGVWTPRVSVNLSACVPPCEELWWLSKDGIHRPHTITHEEFFPPDFVQVASLHDETGPAETDLLHPKYHIPAGCFAYVGNPNRTSTWSLPYLLADGTVDTKRLPKAIGALITNYRGTKVKSIPDEAMPEVFRRLARAAETAGKMPRPGVRSPEVYEQLATIIAQLDASQG